MKDPKVSMREYYLKNKEKHAKAVKKNKIVNPNVHRCLCGNPAVVWKAGPCCSRCDSLERCS